MVTPGVSIGYDADVPKGACIEIPASVVGKVFPTRDDLPMLCHLREVDLDDTELALGDDDGYMAVVMGNRLPQPGVKYLACLVNLEGQYDRLPVIPDEELVLSYIPAGAVYDIGCLAAGDVRRPGQLRHGDDGPAAAGRLQRGHRPRPRRGRLPAPAAEADRAAAAAPSAAPGRSSAPRRVRPPARLGLGRDRRRGHPAGGRYHRHGQDEAGRRVLLPGARHSRGPADGPGAALPGARLLVVHLR